MIDTKESNFISRIFCIIYFFWGIWLQVQNTINVQFAEKIALGRILSIIVLIILASFILLTIKIMDNRDLMFLVIFMYLGIISALHESGLVSLCTFLMAYLVKYVPVKSILRTLV